MHAYDATAMMNSVTNVFSVIDFLKKTFSYVGQMRNENHVGEIINML